MKVVEKIIRSGVRVPLLSLTEKSKIMDPAEFPKYLPLKKQNVCNNFDDRVNLI